MGKTVTLLQMNCAACARLRIQETGIWEAIHDWYFWFLWKMEITKAQRKRGAHQNP